MAEASVDANERTLVAGAPKMFYPACLMDADKILAGTKIGSFLGKF